jgi:transposase
VRRRQTAARDQENPAASVRFVTNRAIPATNNGSERELRPCVIFRKITNGFRPEWGARLYADTRSVIETARRRAIRAI